MKRATAVCLLLVVFGVVAVVEANIAFLYLEKADLTSASAPDLRSATDQQLRNHTLNHMKRLSSLVKGHAGKRNSFQSVVLAGAVYQDQMNGIPVDLSRQVVGSYRGGIIAVQSFTHEQSSLRFNEFPTTAENNWRGDQGGGPLCITKFVDSASPVLLDAALHTEYRTEEDLALDEQCPGAVFNGILEISLDRKSPLEALVLYFTRSIVSHYSLHIPDGQGIPIETVCFDYPLLLTAYWTPNPTFGQNVAFSCSPDFCKLLGSKTLCEECFNLDNDASPLNPYSLYCPPVSYL
ncbi:hypothetical protein QOT17_022038 [Balamuthia mandrillaris]